MSTAQNHNQTALPTVTHMHKEVLHIEFDGSFNAQVQAPWLWVNDPRHVQKGTGQKTETSLSFYSRQARIVTAEWWETTTNSNDVEDGIGDPPPIGSLHPIADMYKVVMESKLEEKENFRWVLKVQWEATDQDGTKKTWDSYFDRDWLRQCFETLPAQNKCSETVRSGLDLQRVEYQRAIESSQALYSVLDSVFQTGAALVTNTDPPNGDDDESAVALLGRKLSGSNLSHGHLYDDVFHVQTVTNAINIAYTSVALPPHQDLAYYESPPGLQLLHCVENTNVLGGKSTLIDGLQAARQLQSLAPDLFDVLTKCSATFIKQRTEADMLYRRPHIRLGADCETIVSVHWSPPFEGPLFMDDAVLASDYYLAYAAFLRLIDKAQPRNRRLIPKVPETLEQQFCDYAHAMTWEYQLQPGETLVFNNLRILHGRHAFSTQHRGHRWRRHLMGCYTNIDESLSQYRILRRGHGKDPAAAIPMVGNGSMELYC